MYNLMLFPGKDDLQAFLASHDLLNTQYLQEKGLTKKIAEIAAERLADQEHTSASIDFAAKFIIQDIAQEVNGFTGEQITPNLLGMPAKFIQTLTLSLQLVLSQCTSEKDD